MKVKYLALLVSAFCSTAAMAANDTQRLEDKLAQLEARLEKAKNKGSKGRSTNSGS